MNKIDMKRIILSGIFALMSLSMVSCFHEEVYCVYPLPDYDLESVWVNDTDKDCTVKWFYMSYGKETPETVQIGPEEKYSRTDYHNSHMLYHAIRISFSFSGNAPLEIENPNRIVNGGKNWWDSLPNTSCEVITDQSVIKTFYLSDVLDLVVGD